MARATTLGLTCAICERSLLLGERSVRFTPDGRDYVDVCPLCQENALEHGWIREGTPSLPALQHERRRHGFLSTLLRPRRPVEPVASDPLLRRLAATDQAIVDATLGTVLLRSGDARPDGGTFLGFSELAANNDLPRKVAFKDGSNGSISIGLARRRADGNGGADRPCRTAQRSARKRLVSARVSGAR